MTGTPEEEDHAARDDSITRAVGAADAPMKIALWRPDGPVCVSILDLPQPVRPRGVCRCGACHADLVDLAADYL